MGQLLQKDEIFTVLQNTTGLPKELINIISIYSNIYFNTACLKCLTKRLPSDDTYMLFKYPSKIKMYSYFYTIKRVEFSTLELLNSLLLKTNIFIYLVIQNYEINHLECLLHLIKIYAKNSTIICISTGDIIDYGLLTYGPGHSHNNYCQLVMSLNTDCTIYIRSQQNVILALKKFITSIEYKLISRKNITGRLM